jgi:hypothetical protein
LKSNEPLHIYEIRPRRNKRGVDFISDVLPFGQLRVRRVLTQNRERNRLWP